MFIDKIEKEILLKPLQTIIGIVERKQPLPILSNVLIEKKGSSYHFVATDLEIHTRHLVRLKETLNRALSERTGQDLKRIKQDVERDYFMTAEEAKEYGIVDEVIRKRS